MNTVFFIDFVRYYKPIELKFGRNTLQYNFESNTGQILGKIRGTPING